jgi:hypothetical protein
MHITLFRALKDANIADDAAEKVVHAFEEHIDMAVSEAMKHYDDRITAMQSVIEAKLDAGFKGIEARIAGVDGKYEGKVSGIQTSIDVLKWLVIAQASLLIIAGSYVSWVRFAT